MRKYIGKNYTERPNDAEWPHISQTIRASDSARMLLKLKKSLKSGMGRAAEAAGFVDRHSRRAMTIVAFHRVNDELPEDGLTCRTEKFIEFCRFFLRNFRIVNLSEQVEACRRGLNMGGTLSVTFDDGYADNFTVAAPLLKTLKIPATFFVTTGFIGSKIVPPWDDQLLIPQQWMSWDQVRKLVSQGFEIGSHTDQHVKLSGCDPSVIRSDLQRSKDTLEREIGMRIGLFAYPFGGQGDISESSRTLIREIGFDCCLSCFGGVNRITSDPYYFQRVNIGAWFASPHQFALEFLLNRI